MNHPMNQVLEEFRKSGVPDRLTLASGVRWIEGQWAVEMLTEVEIAQCQRVTSYATREAARILERYEFAADGGWVVYGAALEGTQAGTVPYFKPAKPRPKWKGVGFGDNVKPEYIKYETPAKCEALPILPFVDDETAAQIYTKQGVSPLEGENFWGVVWRCNLPIAITEGFKKALAMIAQGMPAIAVRGITQWRTTGTDELHPIIAKLATTGRAVYIAFDQDKKLKTRIAVRKQARKLGEALKKQGCKALFLSWDESEGKGIDDVLYAQGDNAGEWFRRVLDNAQTLKQFKREGARAAALATIARLNQFSYPIERITEGEYLPKSASLERGVIHVQLAPMNSGKSTRINEDWVKPAIAQGWFCVVLSPLNSLGRQIAQQAGFPHIHDFPTTPEGQQALWAMAAMAGGIVMCPDSLHRLPSWVMERHVLLWLDEANETIEHMIQGDTLGSRWAEIHQRFANLAQHAAKTGAIVLSQAGLPDRGVDFVRLVSGCNRVRAFQHHKQGLPWDCTVYTGQASGFRSQFLEAVKRGDRLMFVTSSQQEGERMERAIARIRPDLKTVRIDSKTNEGGRYNDFFQSPDEWQWRELPDILILSPSAKSGVSLEGGVLPEQAYFSAVWAYFPALETDTHWQQLGRYRPEVPRHIYIPPFIQAGGSEALANPRAIRRRMESNLRGMARLYELEELASDEQRPELQRLEAAILDYLEASDAVKGAEKSIAHDALVDRLEAAGHLVTCEKLGKDDQTAELWKEIQEEIWREDAQAIASATVEANHTPEWARDTLDALEASTAARTLAHKVLWRDEFPGVLFDDPEECYQALCVDYGAMRRGVLLQAKAENLEAAKESDRGAVERILKAPLRAVHRLPKNYLRELLISHTGILELLDGKTYSNSDPRAQAVKKAALHWANEIAYWLRLQIKPDQTPVEIINKLLRKLGLKGEAIARPGQRGKQGRRVYQVIGQDNPIRVRLLEALRLKLSSSVSTICNKENPSLQIMDTGKNSPPNPIPQTRVATAIASIAPASPDYGASEPAVTGGVA